jgi:sugar O-acyltransferase (sialic acid O-acetyltransferase NeuD family)
MKKALIFGTNDFAELLYFHLRKDVNASTEVCAFTISQRYYSSSEFCGLPVFPFEEICDNFPPSEYGIFVCVGYKDMNENRRKIFGTITEKGYDVLSFIHPTAQMNALYIGKGTIIMPNVVIGEYCTVGNGNIFYHGSIIAHHSHIGNFNFFAINSCVSGHVTINDGCFFGANSTIRNSVTIANQTLVGANAYVDKDTKPQCVIVPSRSKILKGLSSFNINL